MHKLPLFPLNTVLFPGMPMSLHIFEERYKIMIRLCIDEQLPFGVVALQQGDEILRSGKQAVPYLVGCTAHITQVQHLVEGRMNITAVGQERFRIERFETHQPYLVGVVENFPYTPDDTQVLLHADRRLRPWVERYLQNLGHAENMRLDIQQMPREPTALAYLAASLLRVSVSEKQKLLAIPSVVELMERLRRTYRKEATLMEALNTMDKVKEQGPFSLN